MSTYKSNLDKLNGQYKAQTDKLTKTQTELENALSLKAKVAQELSQKNNFLKLREDENRKYMAESANLMKSREMLMKKLMMSEIGKSSLEQEMLKSR